MGRRAVTSSDDEDEEMQKRLNSCIVNGNEFPSGATAANTASMPNGSKQDDLKLYQVRLQDMLHHYLDKSIDICSVDEVPAETLAKPENDECSRFQLFAKAPPGITVPPASHPPELLDGQGRRNVKPYRHALKRWRSSGKDSVKQAAVDGELVKAEGKKALEKAVLKWKANLQRKEEAVAEENKRIKMLKQKRGEAWLPSQRTA